MANEYGSDFMTIVDEDGTEFELEILSTLEYNGFTYLAVIPAGEENEDLQVSILKSVEEDGEDILSAIEDEEELEALYKIKDLMKTPGLIPCTACHYCTESCPQQIKISEVMEDFVKEL